MPLLIVLLLHFLPYAMAAMHCGDCGQMKVPYPLSTSPSCGNAAYKIRCTTGSLWLDTLNGLSYMITSINPRAQTMVIRPATLIPNTCLSTDIINQGIQLDPRGAFNTTSSNTVILLNCTNNMFNLQAPINCSSNSVCHNYIKYTKLATPCSRSAICCDFRTGGSQTAYVIRVHGGGCMAYQSFVSLDPTLPVAKWPEPGVEIAWPLPQEPVCNFPADCKILPSSKCQPDQKNPSQKRCFCKAGRRWDPTTGLCKKCNEKSCKVRKNHMPVIAGALGSVLLLILSGLLVYKRLHHVKREARKNLVKERKEILNANSNGKSAKIFDDKELRKATNNFSKDNLLGTGGFGEVFKGILEDGTIIAVKRAKPGNTKCVDQVLNEVRILCQVNHRCLVRLLGCCVELEQPLLVYEYVSNGTLFEHLHGFRLRKLEPLCWQKRLTIAYQTAEGLSYLHSSAVQPIYHRDVKSSNILLDEKLDAKVSDFGLSRLVETNESDCSHIYTSAQGTLGYLDPEYYLNLQLTDRSDVYSFGVVLLELLTSNKAIDFNRQEDNINLVVYMKKVMYEERLVDAIDPVLKDGATKIELETMKALGDLASACLDERRQNRPSMREVAEEIEYIISIVSGEASKT